jgi:Membrane protease subunits, stomatin/prohibitin homologs
MSIIVVSIVVGLIVFIGLGVDVKRKRWGKSKKQIIAPIITILILFMGCFSSIPANYVGVLYDPFGNGVQENLLNEGIKIKAPYVTVYKLSTEIQELTFNEITVQTNDSQWVKASIQIQARIDRANAFEYFKKYRNKSLIDISSVLMNTTQKELEAVSTKYNIMEVLGEKRDEIVNLTLANIKDELLKDGIIVERLVLVDTEAGETIENAIAKEAAAKKEAETAKYLKEKATLEGEAKVISAQKEKEANDILSKSLTNQVMEKMMIDLFKEKWDGQLPKVVSDGTNIFDLSQYLR